MFSNDFYINPRSSVERAEQKLFMFYTPNPKQESFHEAGNKAIERLFLAGNRTGKTYCGCIEDAIHLTGRYPDWWKGHKFDHPIVCWVASENYEITRNVLQLKLIGGYSQEQGFTNGLIHPDLILKKAMLAGVNGAVDYVHIKHKSGGVSTLYFKSYKQGREKFQGARCHLIHLDEEPPKDIYTECSMRLADVDGAGQGRLILTMTPLKGYTEMMAYFLEYTPLKKVEGEEHKVKTLADLMKEEIIKTTPESFVNGKYYIQASWDDNLHLSEDTKIQLRATLKPHELEARERGIPCIGTGMVYQVPESEFLIIREDEFEIPNHWPRFAGMDIGWEDPTAVVFFAYNREYDRVYVYKEYKVNHQTPQNHASSLLPMGLEWIPTICDPAANQRGQTDGITAITKYHESGLKIIQGKQAKESAIQEVIHRINTDRFKVFATCRKFMDEWRAYSRGENGKILAGNDHLMNALEYGILNGTKYAKTKIEYDARYSYQIQAARF